MKLNVYKENELVCSYGGENRKDQNLEEILIGRSEESDLRLDDVRISRKHAIIRNAGGVFLIERLSEMGDVFINGVICEKSSRLNSGDVILLPPFCINFISQTPLPASDIVSPIAPLSTYVPVVEPIYSKQEDVLAMDSESIDSTETLNKNKSLEISGEELDSLGPIERENNGNNENAVSLEEDKNFGDFNYNNNSEASVVSKSSSSMISMGEKEQDGGTKVVSSFVVFELLLSGENIPYDRFRIKEGQTFIGRDPEKCQIVLADLEVSAIHAVIKKGTSHLMLEDLGSSNGTLLNGQRINKAEINKGDEFLVGSVAFTVEVRSDLLREEQNRLMPVEENQEIEVEQVVEKPVDFSEVSGQFSNSGNALPGARPKSKALFTKDAWKDPAKRKKILIILVGIGALYMFLDSGEKANDSRPASSTQKQGQKATEEQSQKDKDGKLKKASGPKRELTKEEKEFVEYTYRLSKQLFEQGKYAESLNEIEKVLRLDSDHGKASQLRDLAKQGLAHLEELEKKRRLEEENKIRQQKIKELIVKAEDAVKKRSVVVAEAIFNEIAQLDPENTELTQFKIELDAWKEEQKRLALEKEVKEAERKRQLNLLGPGKTFYLKGEWFKAIVKLEDFLRVHNLDEDLIKDATAMIEESKQKLEAIVSPMLGKARSLKEGQDLKRAYETYLEIARLDPSNVEALNEMNSIRDDLENRAKKIYREALISESLSLFDKAKEGLQEVQQISPTDSDYYKKAAEKLKGYL